MPLALLNALLVKEPPRLLTSGTCQPPCPKNAAALNEPPPPPRPAARSVKVKASMPGPTPFATPRFPKMTRSGQCLGWYRRRKQAQGAASTPSDGVVVDASPDTPKPLNTSSKPAQPSTLAATKSKNSCFETDVE